MDAIQRERLLQRAAFELLTVQSETGVRILLFVRVRPVPVQAVVLDDEDHVERAADAAHKELGEVHGEVLDVIWERKRNECKLSSLFWSKVVQLKAMTFVGV